MKSNMLVGAALLMLAATPVFAGESVNSNPGGFYRANELSLDVFGTASVGEYTINHPSEARVRRNTRLGAGLGVNYFFTRYLGVGVDAYSENTTGAFVDSGSVNFIGRLPLGDSGFAPYAFGGGGYQWDMTKARFAQVGAGMEYRFTPNVGAFVDARWVLPDEARYYGVARLGLRFSF